MKAFRHLAAVTTLTLDEGACVGCGTCLEVCPQGVFALEGRTIRIADRDGCMECGACARNCPAGALTVTPGVGCAAYIINSWLRPGKKNPCGDGACC